MKIIKKLIPVGMVLPFYRIKGMTEKKVSDENKKLLDGAKCTRKSIYELAACGNKFKDFVSEYANCKLNVKKQWSTADDMENPVAICVVKNDLMRMKLFLKYYRNLGVKQFAILDDHSDDGTFEFLSEQSDVMLFTTDKGYTTVRRQAWITKIVEQVGFNRWYLILDSDELFDYKDSDKKNLKKLATELHSKGITRQKVILLDMFAADALYSEKISNEDDVVKVCNLFFPEYFLEKTLYDKRIRGGARGVLLNDMKKKSPHVSKYPLIYADERDVFLNSHYYYPFVRNKPDKPSSVLRHYKFLPGDKKKYEERIKKGNFFGNSKDYVAYLTIEQNVDYKKIVETMEVYKDFSSTNAISIMEVK